MPVASLSHPPLRRRLLANALTAMTSAACKSSVPNGQRLAIGEEGRFLVLYHRLAAEDRRAEPAIVFLPGFMSNGTGTKVRTTNRSKKLTTLVKASHLHQFCEQRGLECITYDPEGLGQSWGADDAAKLAEMRFPDWLRDATAAVQRVKSHSIILVGSSMGALMAINLVLGRPRPLTPGLGVAGVMLIAPAVGGIFWRVFEQWYAAADQEGRARLDAGQTASVETAYGHRWVSKAFPASVDFFDVHPEKESLDVRCAVKLLHGLGDDVVPHQRSLALMTAFKSTRVDLVSEPLYIPRCYA